MIRGTHPYDREEKKAQIAAAAVSVFAEKGIDRAKMAEVAREAGVGKGTIYEYFRSKDELFEFAVNQFFDTLTKEIQADVASIDDPERQLEVFIRATFDSLRSAGPEIHIMFEIWAEGVRSGVEYFDLKAMYAAYRELIAGIVREGIARGQFRDVDPMLTASIMIGALDGLMLQWILMEDAIDLHKTPETFIQLVMKGLIQ